MNEFDYCSSRDITITDTPEMKSYLSAADFPSCEYACANLVLWTETDRTRLFVYANRMYFHQSSHDELLFPCGHGLPAPEELYQVSLGMKKAGYSGVIAHTPAIYLQTPGWQEWYTAEPMEDGNDEYIYKVETLAGLHGSKLSKKRNLISQFERNFESYTIHEVNTAEDFQTITRLSEDWRHEHLDTDGIEHERQAIAKALLHFDELGLKGLMLMTTEGLKAYAIFSPLNSNSYTVHFEKALAECKGASQVITNQTALFLRGKCEYINREQDLDIPGLRQAKQSYMPDRMLKDYYLRPKG